MAWMSRKSLRYYVENIRKPSPSSIPPTRAYRRNARATAQVAQLVAESRQPVGDPPAQRVLAPAREPFPIMGPGLRPGGGNTSGRSMRIPGDPQTHGRGESPWCAGRVPVGVSVRHGERRSQRRVTQESGRHVFGAGCSSWIRFRPPYGPAPSWLDMQRPQCEELLDGTLAGVVRWKRFERTCPQRSASAVPHPQRSDYHASLRSTTSPAGFRPAASGGCVDMNGVANRTLFKALIGGFCTPQGSITINGRTLRQAAARPGRRLTCPDEGESVELTSR